LQLAHAQNGKLKIALVTDALFSDGGWGAAAFTAAKQLETKYGHQVSYAESIAIPEIEATLRQYAQDGVVLIIAHGFQWGDPAVKVGKDYPNTKFVVFTGTVSSENVASIFPMQQEGTFLLGAVAGMMTKTNIIGYIGGDQLDPFISGDSTITWKYQSNAKYRRVVPSPKPVAIVDRHAIRSLIDSGFVVVACGGGGIPVVGRNGKGKFGADAVIDKDLAGAFLARQIAARTFVILTDVEGLYLDYRKPSQRLIKEIILSRDHVELSQLEEGSMGPKVQACLQFVKNGGQEAIIASLDKVQDAISGSSGTHFFP
ncbi:MAG: BMP family ABC transporter substrate-binding protein, partial [Nitrososphaera sp.]